ncbi:hypothetical protein ABWH89_01470 [Hoeflea alexandrii]|uniref:hypothetical protein n=1 Tax=Hoeflea alexandrii TaxID=288436 RepID=UPI0035D11B43
MIEYPLYAIQLALKHGMRNITRTIWQQIHHKGEMGCAGLQRGNARLPELDQNPPIPSVCGLGDAIEHRSWQISCTGCCSGTFLCRSRKRSLNLSNTQPEKFNEKTCDLHMIVARVGYKISGN